MTANDFLNIILAANDCPIGMRDVIVRYGDMRCEEASISTEPYSGDICKCDSPVSDAEYSDICGFCGDKIPEMSI